jgi:hypothetical protein
MARNAPPPVAIVSVHDLLMCGETRPATELLFTFTENQAAAEGIVAILPRPW